MKKPLRSWSFLVHRPFLVCASVLVPRETRKEWRKEWVAELWYVCQARPSNSPISPEGLSKINSFCCGAWVDAFWLRRSRPWSPPLRLSSPLACLSFLAASLAVSSLLAFLLPGARNAILPTPYQDADTTVLISPYRLDSAEAPAIRIEDYEKWRGNTRAFFADLAYYEPVTKRIRISRHTTEVLRVARGTPNLFDLLAASSSTAQLIARSSSSAGGLPALVLSQSAWRRIFAGDPNIVGKKIQVAGESLIVTEIVPDNFWRLPGHMDAWLLYDSRRLGRLPGEHKGFVLARWRASALVPRVSGPWNWWVPARDGGSDRFECISLAQINRASLALFGLALMLAAFALPATTPLSLGDYLHSSKANQASIRLRRWSFLLAKFAIIVAISYLVALDAAQVLPAVQFPLAFALLLFGFRWALRDQRRRCPVCLGTLTRPARVGHPSWNFLAWSGMELMCEAGHGLLHVPEHATSWFSTQRWLSLDPSWKSLFTATSF